MGTPWYSYKIQEYHPREFPRRIGFKFGKLSFVVKMSTLNCQYIWWLSYLVCRLYVWVSVQ